MSKIIDRLKELREKNRSNVKGGPAVNYGERLWLSPDGRIANDAIEEIARLRAEADALRDEVEWLRSFLPPMAILVSAVEEEFCSELTEVSEPDHSKVSYPEEDCPITFGMIREARKAVDYAMGDYA